MSARITFEMTGEVVSIGRIVWSEKPAQKIEVDFKGFGIESASLYLHFKGESPYALGDKITITIEPYHEHQHPEKALPQHNTLDNSLTQHLENLEKDNADN